MKWIKWILLGVGGLLVLAIVLVVSFLATFDPNSYKSELAATVKQQTGRDLSIPGDVRLSYFPWLGFETGGVTLGNAQGFGETPFAQISAVKVKVEVLPLLRRVLSIDVVELIGLRLDLQKSRDGASNWDDLAGAGDEGGQTDSGGTGESGGAAPVLAALSLGGLKIEDAAVRYRDAQSGQDITLNEVSLLTGKVVLSKPFDVELNAKAAVNEPNLTAALRMTARLTANLDAQRYTIADLDFAADLAGDPVPAGAMSLTLTGGAEADLAAQVARIFALEVTAGALTAQLDGEVKQLDATPQFDIKLDIPTFDARQLMQELALPPLNTADADVLREVAVQAQAAGSPLAVDVKLLAIALDDTQIEAAAELRNLGDPKQLPRITAQANISKIDLDRYLPSEPEQPAAQTGAGGGSAAPTADDTPIGLPIELLRTLNARAEVKLGAVTVKKLNISDVALVLSARDGVVRLDPLSLSLYDGLFKGRTIIDVRGAQPKFDVRAQLAGVQAGPLLADFMGDDKVHGRSDANLAITTRGETVGALKKALNGTVAVAFQDGAIKDFNLAEELRRAEAKLKKQDYRSAGTQPTDFSSATVSGRFKNGVLHTSDLDLRSPLLRVGGEGQIDVAAETMDYLATVTFTGEKTGQGGAAGEDLKGLPIPVRVTGAFDDPTIKLELAKALEAKARAELKKKTAAEKARLQLKADQAKSELAKKAEEEKSRAEQKAEEEREQAEEELKKKAEEKLKKLFE
ncbi:MAG: AsmA family protein [Gammaproteobacteria bacterium]|nr:AsmA family protein [Gammaproteobacteria bacterium]